MYLDPIIHINWQPWYAVLIPYLRPLVSVTLIRVLLLISFFLLVPLLHPGSPSRGGRAGSGATSDLKEVFSGGHAAGGVGLPVD